jgi:hypothetical protein
MMALIVVILWVVLLVQCVMTLYLHSLFCLTTQSQHSNRDIRHSLLLNSRMIPTTLFAHGPYLPWPYLHPVPQPSFAHNFNWPFPGYTSKLQRFSHQYGEIAFLQWVSLWVQLYKWRLSTDESDFDMYDFYYNEEELNTPPKMDDDTISNLQLPTLQRWDSFLWDGPTKCEVDMSIAYPNLIAYATKLEAHAELDCTICNIMIMGRNRYTTMELDNPDNMTSGTCGISCFAFYILFCKGLEMMRSDKIHTASCTYVHVLSLCHLYPLSTSYLKSHNC